MIKSGCMGNFDSTHDTLDSNCFAIEKLRFFIDFAGPSVNIAAERSDTSALGKACQILS
jgi:hypothetical protein